MTVSTTLFAGLAALAATTLPALAEITIEDAYARSASPMAKTGAAFMIIRNDGDTDDRLVSASTEAAHVTELHTHIDMGDGVMKMTEVEEGFPVPAGGTHVLQRGGDHVMMMGLTAPFVDGETVTVTLVFEEAGEMVVEIPIDLTRMPGDMPMDGGS